MVVGLVWLVWPGFLFFLFGCKRLVECGRLRSKIIDFCSLREAGGVFGDVKWRIC